ncbi:hypothetical protein XELAEV_18027128mg [Xenopus laevis]|uniref:HAT C-terminal dimerisation domain-containing protein n=1 Tax=Xenopus laevis TaxID=8355 RepID=A0A974CUY9_XENLA|nr:hypothetical protein XELAEV_18027128mg [Xenopus laevis]
MQTLYRDLLVRFVKPSIIAGVQDITDINYHDTALHLPANEIMLEELQTLISRFPNIVSSQDMDRLFKEFREYQTSSLPAFPIKRIDEFWQKLSLIQNPRILCKLAKFICLIPHSNATCERLFSTVRKITDQRSSLGNNPITQQLLNTLCAILVSKINLFSQTKCHQWQPSPRLMKSAKSATYISLSSRRQPSSSSRLDLSAAASNESVAGPSSEAVTALGESTSSREPSSAAVGGTSAVSSKDPSISVVSEPSAGSSSEQSAAVVMEPGSSKEPSAASAAATMLKQAKLQFRNKPVSTEKKSTGGSKNQKTPANLSKESVAETASEADEYY